MLQLHKTIIFETAWNRLIKGKYLYNNMYFS